MDNTFKYLFVIRNEILNAYDYNGTLIKLKGNHDIDMSKIKDFWSTWEDKAGYMSGTVDFLILDNCNMSEQIPEKYTKHQNLSWTLKEVANLLNKSILITNHDSVQIDNDDFKINIELESELINTTISSDEVLIEQENVNEEYKPSPNTLGEYFASNIKNI